MSNTTTMRGVKYNVVDLHSSVWNCVEKILSESGEVLGYKVLHNIAYHSMRYNKWIVIEAGDKSDGATYAKDISTFGWLFHDELKSSLCFFDGSDCTNWQASMILGDLLSLSGRWFRRYTWAASTFLFGEVRWFFSELFR